MRGFIVGLVVGLVIGVILAVVVPQSESVLPLARQAMVKSDDANAAKKADEPPLRWNLASIYPSDMPQTGLLARRSVKRLKVISGGAVELILHEPGALVPALDLFDAVASGTVDAGFSSPSYWGAKSSAFELFGGIPFGPPISEFTAWFEHGGGRPLFEDLYRPFNIHSLLCGVTGAAGGGWFKKKIVAAKDLKGMNIVIDGLGARVLAQLGAHPQTLAPADMVNGLKQEHIGGVAFSMPSADKYLVLEKFAANYYFPGWQQQTGFLELMINLNIWDGLSQVRKVQIKTVCAANIADSLAQGEAEQFEVLKNLVIKRVSVGRWPPEMIAALRAAWGQVVKTEQANDQNFRRLWKSLTDFRRDYAIWKELGYL